MLTHFVLNNRWSTKKWTPGTCGGGGGGGGGMQILVSGSHSLRGQRFGDYNQGQK